MEGSHTGSGGTTAGRKYVSDGDILDERGIEVDVRVYGAEDIGEDKVGLCVPEGALFCLCDCGAEGGDDDNVVVALFEEAASGHQEGVNGGVVYVSVGRITWEGGWIHMLGGRDGVMDSDGIDDEMIG